MTDGSAPKTPGEHMLAQVEASRPLAQLIGVFSPKIRN